MLTIDSAPSDGFDIHSSAPREIDRAAVVAAAEMAPVIVRAINVRWQRTWESQGLSPRDMPTVDVTIDGATVTYVPDPRSDQPDLTPLGEHSSAVVGHAFSGSPWPGRISVDVESPIGRALIGYHRKGGRVSISVDPSRIRSLGLLRTSADPLFSSEAYYASYEAGLSPADLRSRGYRISCLKIGENISGYLTAGECCPGSVVPVIEWLQSLRKLPRQGEVIDTTPRPRVRQVRDSRRERATRKARRGW